MWYRKVLGWAAERQDGRTVLPLGNGIVAVLMREDRAHRAVHVLARAEACGPVLTTTAEQPSWAFLADPNDVVPSQDLLPDGVSVLGCPARLTIPAADAPPDGMAWAVPPDPRRRWLPTLAVVICAARGTTARR